MKGIRNTTVSSAMKAGFSGMLAALERKQKKLKAEAD